MYSQVQQDEFVYKLIGNNGYFLDLGAGWVNSVNSNTLFLEEKGWNGICIDGDLASANKRKDKSVRSTVLNVLIPDTNLKDIFIANNSPKTLDYFSLDIEPSSLLGLYNFPFDEYDFKVLTFEHDSYRTGVEDKNKSHDILKNNGYFCLCEDICVPIEFSNTGFFEDWWVNPKYFSEEYINTNTFKQQTGDFVVANINSNI
jgi:hypothetical protein